MAAMAAILEIYFALLLLNRKANLSGNQVRDTGPSWPSCLYINLRFKQTSTKNSHPGSLLMQVLQNKVFREKYEIPLG